jgi:O-antigen ligase
MTFLQNRYYEISIGIALFLQVLFPKLIPIGIILIVLSTIVLAIKKELIINKTFIHLFFLLFYFAYVVGYFFTEAPKEASHVLESKLSFVIFPLLFLFIPKKKLNFNLPIWFFSIALLIQFFIGLFSSYQCFNISHSYSCFLSTPFSPTHHPTYMAVYFLIGFFLVWKLRTTPLSSLGKNFTFLLMITFTVGYILCMSLSAILFLALIIIVAGFIWFRKRFGTLKSIGLVVLLFTGLIIIVDQSKDTISDIKYTCNSLKDYLHSPKNFVKNGNRYLVGNEERLILWTVATEAIMERPLGYGTGNIDIVIGNKLRSYELNDLADKNFNPHNQYLQTCIEIGIIGFLILIGLFISVFRFAWQRKNNLLLIFVAAFTFNSLFESLFQRQSGIVFFALMVFFLLLKKSNQDKTTLTSPLNE